MTGSTAQEKWPPLGRPLKIFLAVLIVAFGAARFYAIAAPMNTIEEFGSAQFSVYARNYVRYGLIATRFLPVFSFIGKTPILYTNHGIGGPLLLGLWGFMVGISVVSVRALAIIVSALTAGVVYLLGKDIWNQRAGLLGATLYWILPLSVYLTHIYQMECPCLLFYLFSVWCTLRWSQDGGRKFWWGAALSIFLSLQCDVYAVLYSPALLFLAYLEKEKRKGYILLALIAPLSLVGYVALLHFCGLSESMARGVTKYLSPWHYYTLEVMETVLPRLLRMTAYLPPLLALDGLRRSRSEYRWVVVLASLPILDLLTAPRALDIHQYRVLMFLSLIGLLGGRLLAQLKDWLGIAILSFTVVLALPVIAQLYQPTNQADVEGAALVREHTTDRDLIVGLPPHMAFYVDRPAIVPYFYHWAAPGTYKDEAEFLADLQIWARYPEYDRIIFFTQFMTLETFPIDYSKTFDANPELQRVTPPGMDPVVWKRVKAR